MPIANAYTRVSADKTAAEIHKMLAKAGAKAVFTEYGDGGEVTGLAFQIPRPDLPALAYKLPVNSDAVLKVMERDDETKRQRPMYHAHRLAWRQRMKAQAQRVAWRIVKDWLRAQLALLEAEMVDLREVFLPYQLTKSGRTVFEILETGGFELPEGRG